MNVGTPQSTAGRLSEQRVGARVVIDHVDGAVTSTVVRLFELGMVPGTPVSVTRRAPLGDPLELLVMGTRLCLRRDDAARFIVRIDDTAPAAGGGR